MSGRPVIYHLVAREYYLSLAASEPYVPETFDVDGFIHCTEGIDNVVDVGNRYYADDPREYALLVIEPAEVTAEIRFEDPDLTYPHIYGALNRDAILEVVPVPRASGGRFLAPPVD